MFEPTRIPRILTATFAFPVLLLALPSCDRAPADRGAPSVETAPPAERPADDTRGTAAPAPERPAAATPASRAGGEPKVASEENAPRRTDRRATAAPTSGAAATSAPAPVPARSEASSPAPVTAPSAPPPSDGGRRTGRREIVWSSDWSTGVGLAARSLRDDARWSVLGGQGLEVVASSGLDFPTSNVLRVTAVQATTGYAFLRKTGLPIPAVGESNYYRWYFRATMPDGLEDPESHPFQDGNASSQSNWLFHVYHDAGAGRWRPQLRPSARSNAYPNDRWSGPALQKNVTYRFEVQVSRTGADTFRMNARIYDHAGTLLHQSDAFTNQTGTATLASNPTFTFLQLANLEGLNAGNNGIAGSPTWPFVYGYQAAIAVCRGDWCGAYQPGEGR